MANRIHDALVLAEEVADEETAFWFGHMMSAKNDGDEYSSAKYENTRAQLSVITLEIRALIEKSKYLT